jgi:flagellar M-ring protein FliF
VNTAAANAATTPPAAGAPAAPTAPAPPVVPPPAGAPTQQTVGSTKSSETTNYEVGRLTTHRTNPSGQIARLSVAVILDDEREAAAADAKTPPAPKARPAEEIQRIQKLVAASVGFDETRGDLLTVDSIAFDTPVAVDAGPEPSGMNTVWEEVRTQVRDNGLSALRTVGVLVIAVVAIFGFLRPMARKALTAPPPPSALPAAAAAGMAGGRITTVQELEGRLDDGGGPDAKSRPLLARRVAQLASEEPEYVARIMRTWLTDEEK